MESAYQVATGKLLVLAPQTYVNCVKNPNSCGGTGGCEGATMELAFNMTAQTGIALETDLPYKGRDQRCSPYKAAVKCTGYVKNPVNDAKAFETAVAKMPQAITVAAGAWQLYGGGIFHGCSGGIFGDNTLDHGVQASATQRIFGLCATAGGRAGVKRVSFACRVQTMTRLSRTSRLQMAWHASHIQRVRPSEASAVFCSIHLTQQASPLATRQLSYKMDSESLLLVPFA